MPILGDSFPFVFVPVPFHAIRRITEIILNSLSISVTHMFGIFLCVCVRIVLPHKQRSTISVGVVSNCETRMLEVAISTNQYWIMVDVGGATTTTANKSLEYVVRASARIIWSHAFRDAHLVDG